MVAKNDEFIALSVDFFKANKGFTLQRVTSFQMPTRLSLFPENLLFKNKMIDFAHHWEEGYRTGYIG